MNEFLMNEARNINYKVIPISIEGKLTMHDKSILKNIFNKFKVTDIKYDISESEFNLFLNCVDFEKLKETILNYKSEKISETLLLLLDKIISELDSIKSYGLKGKKRLYVGYDKERKVRGRKEKENNRNRYYYANKSDFSTINNEIPQVYINKI
ncbi:MAG TPA: hypothetical protein PLU67_04230, partial [Candidatus Kapabacteria bacterium]|nr:hypothetical protein [Candidatus Kapabacteria bacterium]